MEKLPPEIADLIVADVVCAAYRRGELAQLATVSRFWQRAVEFRTMRSIRLDHRSFDKFSAIFSAKSFPHRRHTLRHLCMDTTMPTRSHTPEDHDKNNACFVDVLARLFHELASWDTGAVHGGKSAPRQADLCISFGWTSQHGSSSVPGAGRWPPENTFLTLSSDNDDRPPEFPTVHFVNDVRMRASKGITPHPRALFYIVSRFPSLGRLNLELWEPTVDASDLRIEHRRAVAEGLAEFPQQIPKLSSLEIRSRPRGLQEPIWNHSFKHPDFTEDGIDPLCTAIRKIGEAGKLRHLELHYMLLSFDLFRKRRQGSSPDDVVINEFGCDSTWPSIEQLRIHTKSVMADGRWLYTGDSNALPELEQLNSVSDDDDSSVDSGETGGASTWDDSDVDDSPTPEHRIPHRWRKTPDPALFDPFIEMLVRNFARGMPSLKKLAFVAQSGREVENTVAIQAAAPRCNFIWNQDKHRPLEKLDSEHVRRFKIWGAHNGWEVPARVLALAREWAGDDGVVRATEY